MMKKILALLLGVLLTLPVFTTKAQIADIEGIEDLDMREIVQQVCDELNEKCPEEVDEDMYLLCVLVEDEDLVMYYLLLDGTNFEEWSDEDVELYNNVFEEGLAGNEGFEALKEICKMVGYGLVVKLEDDNENVLTTRIEVDK